MPGVPFLGFGESDAGVFASEQQAFLHLLAWAGDGAAGKGCKWVGMSECAAAILHPG